MYKILITCTLLTAGSFGAQAQFSNPNFENWTLTDTLWDGTPVYSADQWEGGQRSSDSYAGNYAAKVEPLPSCGLIRSYMIYGVSNPAYFNIWSTEPDFTGSGAPINFKPAVVNGFAKFLSPLETDQATGIVILKKFNASSGISTEVGRGDITFSPTAEYAPFTIQVTDLQPGVMPDSIVISFSSGMGFGFDGENVEYGTLYVDQLRMIAGNDLAGISENKGIACKFYPNPTSGSLQVSFETPAYDSFSLLITDASGRQILQQAVTPGAIFPVDLSKLPAGTYIASIQGKGGVYARETLVKTN